MSWMLKKSWFTILYVIRILPICLKFRGWLISAFVNPFFLGLSLVPFFSFCPETCKVWPGAWMCNATWGGSKVIKHFAFKKLMEERSAHSIVRFKEFIERIFFWLKGVSSIPSENQKVWKMHTPLTLLLFINFLSLFQPCLAWVWAFLSLCLC